MFVFWYFKNYDKNMIKKEKLHYGHQPLTVPKDSKSETKIKVYYYCNFNICLYST